MTKRELKTKLILKQEELRNAQSQTGPWILVILGILGLVFIVGIPLLIVGGSGHIPEPKMRNGWRLRLPIWKTNWKT